MKYSKTYKIIKRNLLTENKGNIPLFKTNSKQKDNNQFKLNNQKLLIPFKINRLNLNEKNSLDRNSILQKNRTLEKKNSILYENLTERNEFKKVPDFNSNYFTKNPRLFKIKKNKYMTLLPIKKLENNKENANNNINQKNKKRVCSAIIQNKNLEKNLLKYKIQKNKKKISFSNPIISESISNAKINKKNKQHKYHNSYSKRELELLDNPDSFFFQLYHGTKEIEKNYINNFKLKKDEKIREYRKFIKKDEEEANKQLFLLKKDIGIGNDEKLYGKIISSNTFLDLKIKII